jgi:signal transduction histidine kinase
MTAETEARSKEQVILVEKREIEHIGFLAHELRNALMSVNLSLDMIKQGTVGFSGNTGKVLNSGLKRMQVLIDQSLTEVRLRVDPKTYVEKISVLDVVNQILMTAETEARSKEQVILVEIASETYIESDLQLIYSALSNLIQNAIKYTRNGGRIIVRSKVTHDAVLIEVEDECGGLPDEKINLFAPFKQQSSDRSGLGLGLTIAKRAVELNHGMINVTNKPGRGCVFNISLPLPTGERK